MQILGIDIGFGFTKATDGSDTIIFKSLYGDATEIQFWVDFQDRALTDYFHVTIDGKSYFVGDLAEQQSSVISFTLDQERMISDFMKLFVLTVAGVMSDSSLPSEAPLRIVSGLPVSFFRQYHDRFRDALKGRQTVTFHNPDGSRKVKQFSIEEVALLPQPMGSILNTVMAPDGTIADRDFARSKIGVVDIGFRTTDYTIIDRMRYVERSSRTLDTGIAKAFGIIANKLRENAGVNVELYRLYNAVDAGSIKVRGQGFNIGKIRDQVYGQLAGSVVGDMDRLWANDWDVDHILLTGGGAMALAPHIQPLISGSIRPSKDGDDSRFNNVMGYLKYGKYLWGRSESTEAVGSETGGTDSSAGKE
jgi:plasmid segregation protein ParM